MKSIQRGAPQIGIDRQLAFGRFAAARQAAQIERDGLKKRTAFGISRIALGRVLIFENNIVGTCAQRGNHGQHQSGAAGMFCAMAETGKFGQFHGH